MAVFVVAKNVRDGLRIVDGVEFLVGTAMAG